MKRLLLLGLLQALLAVAKDADLVLIQDEFAKCLDGSPAAYYYRKGEGSGANKWLIYHEAGAWCGSLESCYHRSKMDLGSSKQYPAKAPPYVDFVSSNATRNPVLFNWNMVYFKNCDGAFWMGENMTTGTFRNTTLYFRGAFNRRALLRDLKENRGMVSPSEVIISGASAGGIATYLHADWYAAQLPKTTRVMAIADSGFMLPYKGPGKCQYEELMVGAYELFNVTASVHPTCAELFKESGEFWRCLFFPQYTLPHMQTPIFVLNSRFDSWATEHLLCGGGPWLLKKMVQRDLDLRATRINAYGHSFDEAFYSAVRANPKNGYAIDACHHHTGGWNSMRLPDGRTQADAFSDWYHALKKIESKQTSATELLDMRVPLSGGNQTAPFPCVECCGTEMQSDKRYRGLRRSR